VLLDPGQVGGSSRLVSRLHFDILDLYSRSLTFDSCVHWRGLLFCILVHPMRPRRHHAFTSLRHDLVSASTPTRRLRA
jgi:hypothetical protein